jgi:ABC-type multidrug transport system ATPase subunit
VIPPAPRLGNDVVVSKGLKKAFGEKLLFDDLSFALPRAGIVGIIGPNGAGKTTLFRMIAGKETPDGGSLKLGETVQLAYVDQQRTLNDANTAWNEISGGMEQVMVGKKEMNTRAYLSSFNFKGTDQQKKVGDLSGGERNRLHLAKTLMEGGNLLLLDEPTNDLDVDTLRALEEALLDFSGCAVVISHDRWFLDRVATHILAFEGNSEVVWHEGNYQSYIEDLKRRKGPDADQPHRVQYKKLARVLAASFATGLTRSSPCERSLALRHATTRFDAVRREADASPSTRGASPGQSPGTDAHQVQPNATSPAPAPCRPTSRSACRCRCRCGWRP